MENIVLQDGRKEQIKIVGERQTCVNGRRISRGTREHYGRGD